MAYSRFLFPLVLAFTSSLSALEIYINRSYTSKEKAQATLYASGEGTLFLRIYRIDDVHAYLSGQNNGHTAAQKNERLMQPGYFLWRSVIENVEYSLYQLARRYMRSDYRNRLREDLGLEKYAFPFRDRFPETNLFAPLALPIIGEKAIPIRARHWQALRHEFESLPPGYYLVEASQGRHVAHSPLVISDVAMAAKTSPQNVLIYAVNILTGEPLSGTVTAYAREKAGEADRFVKRQTFDLKGGIAFSDKVEYLQDSQNTLYVLQDGRHFAFSDLYAIDTARNLYEAAIYTDRPVYRIGDLVHVRGVFIRKQAAAAHGKVKYQVKQGDEVIHGGEADLSAAGSIAFSYKTTGLKPARYAIHMEIGKEKHYGSFVIEQYKKPETRAAMTVEKPVILIGETAVAEASASYYSGEALAKAGAEVTIERRQISYPWWFGFGYEDYYGESDDYGGWEFVKDFQAELDARGKLRIPVETLEKDKKPEADFTYRVRIAVRAQNREETMASVRFKAYRAPVSLRLTQERWYFTPQMPITFKVNANSIYDQKPVKTQLKAELIYRQYDRKSQKYSNVPARELTLETNEAGEVSGEFPAAKLGGLYLVRVSATAAGKATHEMLETYVYSSGDFYGDYAGEGTERSISVSANKKQYELFDTAEFAIRLPGNAKKLPVLITLENDRIRKYTLLPAVEGATVYREDLKSELSPNFEITATAFEFDKIPRYYSGQVQVVLPPKHRILRLEVVPDRDRYRPGEEANLVVRAFDYKNKPVSAEFSLGLVDEAIYAIREDSFKSLSLTLNPRLYPAVVTHHSLAFSFYGYGTEKSLYALYREQVAEAAALRKGEEQKVKIRKNFKDTAYFNATGKTGTDGTALLKVPLPDNLTEWRITAHAHSSAGLSGSERSKLVVAKDFALRLAQPRFLRERDEARLRLLVSNQLKEKQTARFETTFEALKADQANFPKQLEIPPGEERYVDFTVTAPFYPADGKAMLRFIARSEKDNDGLEMTLPILPFGVENYVASQKIFRDDEASWNTKLKLDRDARQELAELQVSFIPGVVPSILETLPYLIQYPYGCVEQTLSTFLPAVWASRAAEKLSLPLPVKKTQLTEITDQGLKKLYGYQHGDGGWGWWSDDQTDIYMSAYTLWGLGEAVHAGLKVDSQVISRGTKYLGEQLNTQNLKDLKDNYAIHRLVFAQRVALGLLKQSALVEKIRGEWADLLSRDFKEPAGLALIVAGASEARGRNNFREIRTQALAKLRGIKRQNEQGVFFETVDKNRYYWYSDREETTAQVLNALLAAGVEDAGIPERDLVSYLMTQKKQQRWRSTKLSALITRAFALYAQKTGEKLVKVKVSAEVDGTRRDAEYNPKAPAAPVLAFKTASREAGVKVTRSGSGFFLARAEWKHYLNKPLIVPREGNFKVERRFYAVNKNQGQYSRGEAKYVFKPGELVMTELDLKAEKGSEYLLLEDMIPAGFEPLNANELNDMGNLRYDNYANSPAAVTRLDDRVGLAKTYMSKENFMPRSFYRAVFPGKYQTMPAQGGLMYYPETFAYSASDVITITD